MIIFRETVNIETGPLHELTIRLNPKALALLRETLAAAAETHWTLGNRAEFARLSNWADDLRQVEELQEKRKETQP